MEINYNNPETGNKLTLNTNKSFIFIYGKNGSGKTTFSKNDCFDSEFVFNVDYVNKNILINQVLTKLQQTEIIFQTYGLVKK